MSQIVRRVRLIEKAISGTHGYLASVYNEYQNGELIFLTKTLLGMNETGIRLKKDLVAWEEKVLGQPGWFRCEVPKGYKENT